MMDFAGPYKLKRRTLDVDIQSGNEVDEDTADLTDELMLAAVSFHKLHLKVKDLGSFSAHKALNELYDALPGHADDIVEGYQGASERIIKCTDENYAPKILNTVEDAVSYIRELNGKICELQGMMPYSEIINDLDTVKSTLNSAKYKLLFLK